jgi:hypothetical protein
VTGKVLFDRRGDGKRESLRFDPVVVGTRVYVDTDNDAVLDANESFGVVQQNGQLPDHRHHGRHLQPAGRRPGRVPGQLPGRDVPDRPHQQRQAGPGQVVRDHRADDHQRPGLPDDNINGQFDETTDRGLRDFRVYLDLNSDGLWQRDLEPSRKSDSAGRYAFRDLLAGTYTVRIVPKVAFIQTEPPGTGAYIVQLPSTGVNVINRDFGERLIG